jgi:hypothetical protein
MTKQTKDFDIEKQLKASDEVNEKNKENSLKNMTQFKRSDIQ